MGGESAPLDPNVWAPIPMHDYFVQFLQFAPA